MSANDREGQPVNGSAVQRNDLAPFTREGAHPRRQARPVLLRSGAQAHQPATFQIHDAEETIGVAHTVILVELRMFAQCRMAHVWGPLGTAVSDELGRAAANDVSLPVPRSGPDA